MESTKWAKGKQRFASSYGLRSPKGSELQFRCDCSHTRKQLRPVQKLASICRARGKQAASLRYSRLPVGATELEFWRLPFTLPACRFTNFIAISARKIAKCWCVRANGKAPLARIAARKKCRKSSRFLLRAWPAKRRRQAVP